MTDSPLLPRIMDYTEEVSDYLITHSEDHVSQLCQQVAYRKNTDRRSISISSKSTLEQKEDSSVCEQGPTMCAHLLTFFSLLIIMVTLPLSLCFVVKVVQVIKTMKEIILKIQTSNSRNTREQSYSVLVCSCLEVPEVQECSSLFLVWIFMRRLIWGLRLMMFLHKRFVYRLLK